ncbi:hypothetical protein FOIG_10313 [Fusarium odoratissimum NRRL 54006]|nr:uncharacterized protein FOIG_10313 [Fusarium odoratissimum NRRL 54006]EXL97261.1 hypothetical protein FOIG_10313 [Fusarium odoratissimum NRRL 54006]TXB95553.1 hypothetical protein FocTR4_00016102 [Fusarium oxysporum f. sp. cubense]
MALVPYTKQQLDDCILMPHEPSTSEFHVFNKLPYDLRHKIWESSLLNYRHIKVLLADDNNWEFSIWNCRHRKVFLVDDDDEKQYEIFVKKSATYHALLNTTSESRNVAKTFYRVQMPCRRMGPDGSVDGTLFLCPELDTIQVETHCCSLQHFEKFSDAIFTADKHDIGLVNLALDCEFRHIDELFSLDENEHTLFTDAIRRIEVLTFVGRVAKPELLMYGSDLRVVNSSSRFVDKRIDTESYDRGVFNYESGLYENELKAAHIGKEDPRRGYYSFCLLMEELKIPEDVYKSNLTNELFMLTYNYEPEFIPTNGDPHEYRLAYNNSQREYREYNQGPPPAIGFWLFPLSVIGPFFLDNLNPLTGLPSDRSEAKMVKERVVDVSECDSSFCFYHPAY